MLLVVCPGRQRINRRSLLWFVQQLFLSRRIRRGGSAGKFPLHTKCNLDFLDTRHVQNQILIGRDWYVIYTRSWFRSCMGLRLRSRLGNFGKISRDFGKYSSRPGFSVYNLGKITEIWSRLIFFVYCSLNLNTVIVLLPRKQREKRTRSRISRSRRDLQWTEMDMSAAEVPNHLWRAFPFIDRRATTRTNRGTVALACANTSGTAVLMMTVVTKTTCGSRWSTTTTRPWRNWPLLIMWRAPSVSARNVEN